MRFYLLLFVFILSSCTPQGPTDSPTASPDSVENSTGPVPVPETPQPPIEQNFAPSLKIIPSNIADQIDLEVTPPFQGFNFGINTTVEYFNDGNCENLLGSITTTSFQEKIVLTTLIQNPGVTNFSSSFIDELGIKSLCSSSVSYTYVQPAPKYPTGAILLSESSPSINSNPKIQIQGVDSQPVEIYLNSTCSGSPAASSSTNVVTLNPLEKGRYDFYAKTVLPSGELSPCSKNILSYESLTELQNRFQLNPSLVISGRPMNIDSGDLDGDGHDDYVYTDNTEKGQIVFGRDKARFILPLKVDGGLVKIIDANEDGKKDILVADGSGAIRLFMNNSNRSFTHVELDNFNFTSSVAGSVYRLFFEDLDRDGKKDIIYSLNRGGYLGRIYILKGKGGGEFHVRQEVNPTTQYIFLQNLVDIDHDGDLDILTRYRSEIEIYLNLGNNTFQNTDSPIPVLDTETEIQDMNGDLYPDIISFYYDRIVIMINNRNGGFISKTTVFSGSHSLLGTRSVLFPDVNGDGIKDIVVNHITNVSILYGKGDGSVKYPVTFPFGESMVMAILDYDHNGTMDILGTNLLIKD